MNISSEAECVSLTVTQWRKKHSNTYYVRAEILPVTNTLHLNVTPVFTL